MVWSYTKYYYKILIHVTDTWALRVIEEQVVSCYALVHETRKVDNDHSTELKIVPNKLAVEDKYIVDYRIGEPLTVFDEQVIENQYVKEISITSVNSLNCSLVIKDNNGNIPFKYKRIRKAPVTMTDDFLW
jgi:hypothetical protein